MPVVSKTQVPEPLPEIIVRSLYTDQKKPHRWVLLQPIQVVLSNGDTIVIHQGFVTDFASVPRLLWGVVATVGRHNLATLIHDYLYVTKHSVGKNPDEKADRLFADKEMLFWLHRCGVTEIKAQLMYFAVRFGGRSWWKK